MSTPLQQMLSGGNSSVAGMINAAGSGTASASQGFQAMRRDAQKAREQAKIVNSQANVVNNSASDLKALIPEMNPYRNELEKIGGDLYSLGSSLTDNAKGVFWQGEALMNLDPSKGGLSAEYIKQYNSLSPDEFVSRAASDVQGSFKNVQDQQFRDLARRGVSLSSGAAAKLTQDLGRALAVASSAAKTNAWQKGKDAQTAMLGQITSAANTMYDVGNKTQAEGTKALLGAADSQKGAADIINSQGSMLKAAGDLQYNAGALYKSAADIFGDTAKIEGSAAQLGIDAAKNLIAAYGAAIDYYGGIAKSMISADAQTMAAHMNAQARVASVIAS